MLDVAMLPPLACLHVPALPLQLLIQRHDEWRDHPAAVLDRDTASGILLWLNRKARRHGLRSGMRYSTALGLANDLRAGTISDTAVGHGTQRIHRRLQRFCPDIEIDEEPGIFWLSAAGLQHLFPSPNVWAESIQQDLLQQRIYSRIAIGWSRINLYAMAHTAAVTTLFTEQDEEAQAVSQTPLTALALDPEHRDTLHALGIRTVSDFLVLPPAGILERFGLQLHRLHQRLKKEEWRPVLAARPVLPLGHHRYFEPPLTDTAMLWPILEQVVPACMQPLRRRHCALSGLILQLVLEDAPPRVEVVHPAAPTLDSRQVLELLRLRLERLYLDAGLTELTVRTETVRLTDEQLLLFSAAMPRDPEAANDALARIRAEFGDGAVVHARLADSCFPHLAYIWEVQSKISSASGSQRICEQSEPREVPQLVRRIYSTPAAASKPQAPAIPEAFTGLLRGTVAEMSGPFTLSGRWWTDEPIHHDYYDIRLGSGAIYWAYYDHLLKQWFVAGRLE
jgi:protein ImuB